MKRASVLVLFLFVVLSMGAMYRPACSEWLALALMICAGIPHGSFDLRVAEKKWREGRVSKAAILGGYLLCVLGMSALCVFIPAVGLLLFLALSAIHFSEGEVYSSAPPERCRGVLFGVGAIVLPIGLHLSEAQPYLSYFISSEALNAASRLLEVVSVTLTLLLVGSLSREILLGGATKNPDTVERVVCLCAWVLLPPLAGFAVWFIGRHSRQHLELCKCMFSTSRVGIPLDFAVISLLAIGGLSPFVLLFDFSQIHQLFAASLCLIAGLTLPHMIVSHGMREVLR